MQPITIFHMHRWIPIPGSPDIGQMTLEQAYSWLRDNMKMVMLELRPRCIICKTALAVKYSVRSHSEVSDTRAERMMVYPACARDDCARRVQEAVVTRWDITLSTETKKPSSSEPGLTYGCGKCGRVCQGLECGKCRAQVYCSRACQKKDWSRHRGLCRIIKSHAI